MFDTVLLPLTDTTMFDAISLHRLTGTPGDLRTTYETEHMGFEVQQNYVRDGATGPAVAYPVMVITDHAGAVVPAVGADGSELFDGIGNMLVWHESFQALLGTLVTKLLDKRRDEILLTLNALLSAQRGGEPGLPSDVEPGPWAAGEYSVEGLPGFVFGHGVDAHGSYYLGQPQVLFTSDRQQSLDGYTWRPTNVRVNISQAWGCTFGRADRTRHHVARVPTL